MEQIKLAGIKADKKVFLGIVIAGALVLTGALLYTNGFIKNVAQKSDAGDCLILAQEYCDVAQILEVDAQGAKAAVFNLPTGTPIYMPFKGVYVDEVFEGAISKVIKLSIPNTNSVVRIVLGGYTPSSASGASVSKGKLLGATTEAAGEASAFNFVVYTESYDITNLFK